MRSDMNGSGVMELKVVGRKGKTGSHPQQTRPGVSPESDSQDDAYDLPG
jgi:hypothetical protein